LPDILLLDEPTNHLDLLGIEWLESELAGTRSEVVLISHDRRLEARIEALNGVLADPDLYARDRARFEAASSTLVAAREELTAAEEQWLALEMRREEIEGPGSSD
jgi:ATPase subunit of ABC transporter with duplicated ATPase domains